MAVFRIYVEKKAEFADEAASLLGEIRGFLGIRDVNGARIINRYDVEGVDESLFEKCRTTVFSEPQVDLTYSELPDDLKDFELFAVEYLPGQFDQRADSAAQCIQLVSQLERPTVRTAKIYAIGGGVSKDSLEKIKKYVINPVESRLASFDKPDTLKIASDEPADIAVIKGFTSMSRHELDDLIKKYGFAMDSDDIEFCRNYFSAEHRDPTMTELRMIDTYWSDHCRHTTFGTIIDGAEIADPAVKAAFDDFMKMRSEIGRDKPVTLMELATLPVRYYKKKGLLPKLDDSEEINACTVKIKVTVDGEIEDWLLLFKNETHNHPTEIEPFGGAATCIGGAIRDPLSGRAYVYQAMRITGAADPLCPIEETMPGKLPQKKLVTTAAAGYSSYGNQIGLATGLVDEIYHPGYAAKRLEIGAVVAAAPSKNVIRLTPAPGDKIILIGGKTGRDGCGGATGSSKSHDVKSISTCGAEVQKGNAPEERKLQRLFRNSEATRLIKRCNDFGAGGVSVAIGELADGLFINLDRVPKKYQGLDGTEIAISESQERMAVVVSPENAERFIALANGENLEATTVAEVTKEKRLKMNWRGKTVVDVSRGFLNSNGAEKHTTVSVPATKTDIRAENGTGNADCDFAQMMKDRVSDLNFCSRQGLCERFDSTIGAGSVMMPFGGKYQLTPLPYMAAEVSLEKGRTDDCSVMSWGFDPFVSEKDVFYGAYSAVYQSVMRLAAAGAPLDDCYLTFQEYFERMGSDPERWGKPFAALLGSIRAQRELGIISIGGKDSMSGTFEKLDVPPTLVSFAVTMAKANELISNEFKTACSEAVTLSVKRTQDGFFDPDDAKRVFALIRLLKKEGKIVTCHAASRGGIAEAVFKMSIGNKFGFQYYDSVKKEDIFRAGEGTFILELADGVIACDIAGAKPLGAVIKDFEFVLGKSLVTGDELLCGYSSKLEPVFPMNPAKTEAGPVENISFENNEVPKAPKINIARPTVLIPVFPGTNCEYDTARAFETAGGDAKIFVINNLSPDKIAESAKSFCDLAETAQIIALPGGFSGGDEPDGSGKFITAFFRHPGITEQVRRLLFKRDGLMCGICNGFQALIKLGLVPFGDITDPDESSPTLTYNTIGRHQSKLVATRVCSNKSPWLSSSNVGDIHTVAISHGEGRFICDGELFGKLVANGQIATQYADIEGNASMDIRFNPNGSYFAVEGITSPDGRVFGKMGHSERRGEYLYRNVPGNKDNKMFENAVNYFAL